MLFNNDCTLSIEVLRYLYLASTDYVSWTWPLNGKLQEQFKIAVNYDEKGKTAILR